MSDVYKTENMPKEKMSEELGKKVSEAPELSMEGLEVTPKMVLKLIGDAAKAKEEELLTRLHKAAKKVAEPAISIFNNKDFTMAASNNLVYHNPRNARELELLRSELDGLYGYFRRNSCFHPVNGNAANQKRQKELRKKCPSIAQVELRKDSAGHYQESILIIAGLDDCPQSAFWMSFEF